jgi:hypothetical protein
MRLPASLPALFVHAVLAVGLSSLASMPSKAQGTSAAPSAAAAPSRATPALPPPLDGAGLHGVASAGLTALGRSPTEAALAGTWLGVSPYADDSVERFLLTLKVDGSYTLVVRMRKPTDADASAPAVIVPSAGRWSASGGIFVTVATQAGDRALDLRDRNLGAIYAVRGLDAQSFSYQHIASGAFYPTRRVSADTALTGTDR